METSDRTAKSGRNMSVTKAAFLVYFLLEGLQRMSGIFFLETKESLHFSRLSAALPFVLGRATGRVTDALLECLRTRLGAGTWIAWGCFLSATAVGLCFLTDDIASLSVFWGIFFGAGLGMASPPLTSKLSRRKEQDLHTLYLTAPSLCCVIFPFIINAIIARYGLNGCYVIMSGVILNGIPVTLTAMYDVNFRLPRMKWRIRKRSKIYQMSEKNVEDTVPDSTAREIRTNHNAFTNASFVHSLEPGTLQTVYENEDNRSNCSETSVECINIFQPIIHAKSKMATDSQESSKTKQSIQDAIYCKQTEYYTEKISELVDDIHNYEKNRTRFESSFCHKDALSDSSVNSAETSDLPKHNEDHSNKSSSVESSTTLSPSSDEQGCREGIDIRNSNCSSVSASSDQHSYAEKDAFHQINEVRKTFPFEIKVRVVECTVTTSEYCPDNEFGKEMIPQKRHGYRRHSNSLITASYDNIDFTQMFQHENSKSAQMHKLQCNLTSRMYLISEDAEFDVENQIPYSKNDNTLALRSSSSPKTNSLKLLLKSLAKPSCQIIIYANIIRELVLTALLTVFADLAKDVEDTATSSSFVLVAFGLGGILGQLSFTHWGNRLLVDGSHAATAVIFLLNGVVVAGILWSANIYWLSGFYAALGFIEAGILFIVPKLIVDFIDKKVTKALSLMSRCLSGVAVLCVPFIIGISRDDIGDYDGLLQVASCACVLCAILCYFLPRLPRQHESDHQQDLNFQDI